MASPAFSRSEPDARRASLISACARVLARVGAAGASVRAIAAEAGVSPGLVNHHFGSVDAQVSAVVGRALDAAVKTAGKAPRARLRAYVHGSFAPPIADPELLATWIAFWSLVRARRDIAALHDTQYAGYRAMLERLLGDCGLPPPRRRLAAIAVTALVDGLWLELCLSPGHFSAEEARAIADAQLDAVLAG
jgi:TetR/AcrR family transcriptional regulator, transcriptional repressor of bet genes